MLASSPLAGLERVSQGGGDRMVTTVRLAEQLGDLEGAPAGSFVVLSRAASEEAVDYRLDMALRWAAIHQVAAVAAFAGGRWRPTLTAMDIAERAGVAMVSVPGGIELTWLLPALIRETGGPADRALGRAEQGLAAVLAAEESGADVDTLRDRVGWALGVEVGFRPTAPGNGSAPDGAGGLEDGGLGDGAAGLAATDDEVSAPVLVGTQVLGHFTAPDAHGDLAVAARLVLHTAASAAGRLLDIAARARDLPVRSRSELLAEMLMTDTQSEDLLDRARQLGVPVGGWHLVVHVEAENLDELRRDEVHSFEILETAGQVALQAVARAGGTWHVARVARAVVLVRMTSTRPGPQAGLQTMKAARRALDGIRDRFPGLRVRAGVGTPHEGPVGLRASAAEARVALLAARAGGRPDGVAAHDAVGVRRMLMEWYASDSARASVRSQLAPLEELGQSRGETAIRTLATYLDQQGSIIRTAEVLHLHRNAVTYRLRRITELLDVDLDDPDQRLALQLACRARLLA
jgi:sugar diacid utilization regulator